jgi:hypothetical protein
MKESGWALVSLGVLLLLGALLVDVSVDVGYIPPNPYLPSAPREVANLHAMHVQSLIVQGGLASIICGVITIGFGSVVEAIREGRQADSAASAVPPADESAEMPASDQPELAEAPPDNGDKVVIGVVVSAVLLITFLWLIAGIKSDNGNVSNEAVQNAMDAANAAAEDLQNAAAELARESGRVR